ncbi:MAG TPA: TonB family protein [Pyrinomonadaceae bacterium]
MKGTRILRGARFAITAFSLALIFAPHTDLRAQQAPAEEAPEADVVQRRVTRARALAAVGKLAAAAQDLEQLRTTAADDSVRDVASILLMNIYVEMPDYARAHTLLEEAFKGRASRSEAAVRSHYALAGQTVGSVRAHVERYRSFGINVVDEDLPTEAKSDLEQMRALLERVWEQAKSVREEEQKSGSGDRGADATALIEEAANVRLRLARGDEERARWRQEVSEARQRLVAAETRITKVSDIVSAAAPAAGVSANNVYVPPASTTGPAPAQPAPKERAANASKKTAPAASNDNAPRPELRAESAKPADAAAPKQGGLFSVGSLQGLAAKKVSPSYPSLAKSARITGVVTVFLVLNENGTVESVQRADGPAQLQTAATDAVRRWKFRQTLIDGQPVKVSGYINFNFSL